MLGLGHKHWAGKTIAMYSEMRKGEGNPESIGFSLIQRNQETK